MFRILWLRRHERMELGLSGALASILDLGRRVLGALGRAQLDEAPARDPWVVHRDFDLNRPLG